MRPALFLTLALLIAFLGCFKRESPKYPWETDPYVSFVQKYHKEQRFKELSTWDAWRYVLAVKTLCPQERWSLMFGIGGRESRFNLEGVIGDDGNSLGTNQVQHRWHRHVNPEILRRDITTNVRCAVEHMKFSDWNPQVYNAGKRGAKRGKGKKYAKDVRKIQARVEKWIGSNKTGNR